MSSSYPRPPITEAVIELRFEQMAGQDAVEKGAKRLDKLYVFSDPEEAVDFQVDVGTSGPQVNSTKRWSGRRLSSIDRAEVTLLRTNAFVCSRLAPYDGWEALRSRAQRDWSAWKRGAGTLRVDRVGVRFINRLDIPVADPAAVPIEDYITFQPRLPFGDFLPMGSYAMQVVQPLGLDQCTATLTTATVPPALLEHASCVLDIDVYRDSAVPQRDEDLWELIERMREHKNRLFEGCITDQARALFQ